MTSETQRVYNGQILFLNNRNRNNKFLINSKIFDISPIHHFYWVSFITLLFQKKEQDQKCKGSLRLKLCNWSQPKPESLYGHHQTQITDTTKCLVLNREPLKGAWAGNEAGYEESAE